MKFGQVADYKKGNNTDMQSRDMLKFDFSGKGLEIVSSSHLCMYRIYHIKRFPMLCNIN